MYKMEIKKQDKTRTTKTHNLNHVPRQNSNEKSTKSITVPRKHLILPKEEGSRINIGYAQ